MLMRQNGGKTGADCSDARISAWKKQFFAALRASPAVTTVFLRVETQHVQKKIVEYHLIPTIGWKVTLPAFVGSTSEQVIALRREISATLKINGLQVIHRDAQWMTHLKMNTDVGISYAKLCGAV